MSRPGMAAAPLPAGASAESPAATAELSAGASVAGAGLPAEAPAAGPSGATPATAARSVEVATPHGPARVHLRRSEREPRGALLLGHGAGGGVAAPDLQQATTIALAAGYHVALVEQPYRVAGRRAPAPARQLDAAWLAVVDHLRSTEFSGLPLVFGGRSSGARVACRTAGAGGAGAVLCLAFPVHPPGKPDKPRLAELDAVTVPVLVVQGNRDPFGRPEPAPGRQVVLVDGDHSLKKSPEAWAAPLRAFFAAL